MYTKEGSSKIAFSTHFCTSLSSCLINFTDYSSFYSIVSLCSLCVTFYSSFFCVLFRVADAFISFYHHPHIIMAHIDEIILNVISKLNLYKGLVFLLLLLLLFVNITSIIQHQWISYKYIYRYYSYSIPCDMTCFAFVAFWLLLISFLFLWIKKAEIILMI